MSPLETGTAETADLFDDFRAGPFEALDKPALVSNVICLSLGALLLWFVLQTPVRPIESLTIEQLPERVSRLLLNESDLAKLTTPERLAVPADMMAPGKTKKAEEAEAPPTESEVAPPPDAVGVPQRGSRGGGGGGGAGGPGAGGAAAAANVAATLGATGALAEVDRIVGDFTGVVASERGGKALRQGGAGSGIERRAGTPGAHARSGADLGGVDEILGGAGGGSGGRGTAGTAAGLGGGSGGGAGRPQVRIAAPAAIAGSEAAGAGRQPGALMAVVQRHAAAVRFCYNRYLQKKPGATGQLVLRLTVAADGSVTSASVARSTFNDSELEACVVSQAREWRFAPADEASFTFDVPFVFTPPAEG